MIFVTIFYWIVSIYFIWKLENIVQESWGFGLRLIVIATIFLLPAFQYWCSFYRKVYLSNNATFIERYITSLLVPLAPVGYNLFLVFENKSATFIYLFLVLLGVLSFSNRAQIFSYFLPLDKKPGDLFLFNKFPPQQEADLIKLKLLGFVCLLFPLLVSHIH